MGGAQGARQTLQILIWSRFDREHGRRRRRKALSPFLSTFFFWGGVPLFVKCCFFHFGFTLFLQIRTCYLLGGIDFCYLVTHTPTLQGFCADAHRFTRKCWRSVGGVGVGGTNQPTHHPTHPANHLLANSPIYPYPPSHHAWFLRRRASLNNGSDPKTICS